MIAAIEGCPSITKCHSLLRPWWVGSEGHFLFRYFRNLKSYFEDCNYGRFLVSGLNERHRTGSDRTEQRTGTNGTAFPLDRSMTV